MKLHNLILIFALITSCNTSNKNTINNNSEIVLNTSTGNIYGTLTMSETKTKSPLIIIIPGSGGNNRDGNMLPVLHTNTYKMLAKKLAENGISSLRYDKRGVAKSKEAMESESELRFETYVSDVVDWVSMLQNDDRFSSITLLGHSEGSLIGILAATKVNISALISVSGAGGSADKLIKEQLKVLPPQLLQEANRAIDSLCNGKTVSDIDPALNTIFRPNVQPYLISWIKYNPAVEIAKLKIPTLIIQGNTDLQVSVNEARILHEAKPDGQLVIIENMNHVLKETTLDLQENKATYKKPDLPLKPEIIKSIVAFININYKKSIDNN